MPPWNGPQPTKPWDVLQADAVLQFAPWRAMVFDAWSKGQLPFWNPHQLMGTPLLANSQSAGFYPPHILLGLLHVPVFPAMTFLAWLHLFWAGLGIYFLVGSLGGSRLGGVIGGLSFSLSAFMVSWTALPSVTSTVSWIPWALVCGIGIFKSSVYWNIDAPVNVISSRTEPADALAELMRLGMTRRLWIAGCGASVGMMLLAGHLQFAAFGLLSLALVALWLGVRQSRLVAPKQGPRNLLIGPAASSLGRTLLAVGLGAALAAPQLLPVLAFSRHSPRIGRPSEQGFQAYASGAIKPFELLGVVDPTLLGNPGEHLRDVDTTERFPSFWPAYVKRGASFPESAIGIGPLVLLLLCLLPRRKNWLPNAGPILLVGFVGLLIAMASPLARVLYFGVPGWSSTGSPGRAGVLFVLAACTAAGLAVPSLSSPAKGKRAHISLLAYAALVLLPVLLFRPVTAGLVSFASGISDVGAIAWLAASLNIETSLVLASGIGLIGYVFVSNPRRARPFVIGLAIFVPWMLSFGVLRTGKPGGIRQTSLSPVRHAFINSDWNLFVRPDALLPPNLASLMGGNDIAGYDSLLDRDTKAILDGVNGQDSAPPENGNMMLVKPTADINRLAELGVEEVWRWNASGAGMLDRIRLGQSRGRAYTPLGSAQILEDAYDHSTVIAEGPGLLTVLDRNMPGWSVRVDGGPGTILPGPFRQVQIPSGRSRLVFDYAPPGFKLGLALFGLGAATLAGLLGPGRKSASQDPQTA